MSWATYAHVHDDSRLILLLIRDGCSSRDYVSCIVAASDGTPTMSVVVVSDCCANFADTIRVCLYMCFQ